MSFVCDFDATLECRELVISGRLLGNTSDNLYKLGTLAVKTAVSILEMRVIIEGICS